MLQLVDAGRMEMVVYYGIVGIWLRSTYILRLNVETFALREHTLDLRFGYEAVFWS